MMRHEARNADEFGLCIETTMRDQELCVHIHNTLETSEKNALLGDESLQFMQSAQYLRGYL